MAKKEIRVVGLAASPRCGGNSETLLDAFLAGAAEAGAQAQKIVLAERRIAPCDACESCHVTGRCHHADDVAAIGEQLLSADIVALATPVYFYSVTTYAKLLIDRAQVLWARQEKLGQLRPRRGRGVLLGVAAGSGERLFDGIRLTVKYWMGTFFTDLVAERLYHGFDGLGAIAGRVEIVEDAWRLGRELVVEVASESDELSGG